MSYENYIDFKNVKKVLVIKLRHLGDVLLSTPVFNNLKKKSIAKVDAFIYEDCLEVLKNNKDIDEILTYDKSIKNKSFFYRLKYEFKILNKIRKNKYDLIINLTEGDRGAIIALFSKARYKVGLDPEKKGFFKKEKIYSHLVKNSKSPRHTVEKNLDAIRRIGIFPENGDKNLKFHVPTEAVSNIKDILFNNEFFPNDYILIHPTTRWRFKCWNKFDVLLEYLLKQNQKVVIVSGKVNYEIKMVKEIIKKHSKNPYILNLSAQISIDELSALIKMSKHFYCLDSFSFHLANSLNANVTALFGPTCDITWGVWKNDNAKIVKSKVSCRPCSLDGCGGSKQSECMKDITLNDLF